MARTEQNEKQTIIYQPVSPLQKDYTVQKEQKAQRHDQEEGPDLITLPITNSLVDWRKWKTGGKK
jgi:hypothetical protein